MKRALICVLLYAASLCVAATYYVDSAGTDDPNHGTLTGAGAWKTIAYGMNSLRGGVAKGQVANTLNV